MIPRRLAIAALIAAAVGLGIWYWSRPEPAAVNVRAAEIGPVETSVANTRAGTVKACRRAHLSPASSGQVNVLNVREGDQVKTGEILLELWNLDLRARLRLADSELAAGRARTEEVCLNAERAEREAKRLRPLRASNMVSEERLDQTETESLTRAAACRTAKVSEQMQMAQVEVANAALERTVLRAPFDGVVAEVNGEIGEIVTPSPIGVATPPAVDLINCGCVYVSAPIDEVDAPAIRVGMPVRVTLDAFPDQVFEASVRRTAPYILDVEKQARTLEVEVDLLNTDRCAALLPGYSADIEVILDSRAKALRIPTEAVLEGNRVLILGVDGVLQERVFEPGLSNWRYTEVNDGIQPGERVVVSVDRPGVVAGVPAVAEP